MSASPEYGYPDLPGFDKRNRELIYAMCDAGWTGRRTSKGHWLALAPDGKSKITVPAKDGNNRGWKNAHAQFMRWLREHMPTEERDLFDMAKAEDDPLMKDVLAESLVKKQATRVMHERDERIHAAVYKAIEEGIIVIEPLIRPWLARKQPGREGGQRYESQAVLERVWPDGRTDYACAFAGCDYASDKPRSVANHYGAAHTAKGESDPAEVGPLHPDPTYTEPTTTRDYRPTQRLVDALAEFMQDTAMVGSWDSESLAIKILTWFHDRPDIEHTERPLVPLTDRQMLDKIRVIVGQPDQSEEIDALRARVTQLEGEVTRLTEERRALRDLLSEDGV